MKRKEALVQAANANAVKSAYPDGKRRVVVELRRGYIRDTNRLQFCSDVAEYSRATTDLLVLPSSRIKVVPDWRCKRKGLRVYVYEDVTLSESRLLFKIQCAGKPKKARLIITW